MELSIPEGVEIVSNPIKLSFGQIEAKSLTDLHTTDNTIIVDSAKLKSERVFRIQINDVNVRLKMLENNEMDALLITEPQAGQARLLKHKVLLDTRKLDLQMGVLVAQGKGMDDKNRKRQMEAFEKGYKEAVDSINHYGVAYYKDLIVKYCKVKPETVDLLDKTKFEHIAKPRPQDIERAQKWLSKH